MGALRVPTRAQKRKVLSDRHSGLWATPALASQRQQFLDGRLSGGTSGFTVFGHHGAVGSLLRSICRLFTVGVSLLWRVLGAQQRDRRASQRAPTPAA